MNRRSFLSRLGIGTATVAAGSVPLIIKISAEKTETVNVPKCGGCGYPLILKGSDFTAQVSCTNEHCGAYFDDAMLTRIANGPLGGAIADEE